MRNCTVYENLNMVNEMHKTMDNGLMTLTGCFGVCSKKNRNNRIYEKDNYGQMVKTIQERIAKDGCIVGELEHPTGLNVNLENVSHKITNIQMNEDGVISGTIQLLNTPKGKIAQALVEGGAQLFISSRASGNVDKEGHVKLEQLVTYDLVGTPGFEEARMQLDENQYFEALTESLCIVGDKTTNENNAKNQDMNKEEHDKLLERITDLETKNEILENRLARLDTRIVEGQQTVNQEDLFKSVQDWTIERFAPVLEKWITEEAIPNMTEKSDKEETLREMKEWVIKEYSKGLQKWIIEEYSPEVEKWITNEYSPIVEKWTTHEFAPVIQKWIVEEFSPEVEKWIVEHYSPEVEKWAINEFAPGIQGWITEQFSPELEKWLNEHYSEKVKSLITEHMQEDKQTKLNSINEVLNMLEGFEPKKPSYSAPINENLNTNEPLFIQKMPTSVRPLYESASDGVKDYINRKAQLYNFSSDESIERFWESVDFNKDVQSRSIYEGLNNIQDERERAIRAQFRRNRR